MELLRAFIAIELPDSLKQELVNLQNVLKSRRHDYIKWVEPSNMHLTLKFLGDVPGDKIKDILSAMQESVAGVEPFSLFVKGLGTFPSLKRIQVIWVGLEGELATLMKLQKNIEENLDILGFPPEEREFTPHLTLGRLRFQPPDEEKERITGLITGLKFESDANIKVTSLNLMKSVLTPKGPVYTRLGEVDFGAKKET